MLYVDVKDILQDKVDLEKTNSWDSPETKNKQVGNNIINNSWVLYNKIFNNTINEEIEKRIPIMNYVECNNYNENEIINVNIKLKRKTITGFMACMVLKHENANYSNDELEEVITNYISEYLEKQQHTTSSCIIYDGHIPDMRVLKKLKQIGQMIDCYETVNFKESELKQIIRDVVNNPVERTELKYMKCLKDFAKNSGNGVGGMWEVVCNMRGFTQTVNELIKEKYPNSKYAN
jgi:hypothetical protein